MLMLGYGSIYNHQTRPENNIELEFVPVEDKGVAPAYVATRGISAGEELFVSFDRGPPEPQSWWSWLLGQADPAPAESWFERRGIEEIRPNGTATARQSDCAPVRLGTSVTASAAVAAGAVLQRVPALAVADNDGGPAELGDLERYVFAVERQFVLPLGYIGLMARGSGSDANAQVVWTTDGGGDRGTARRWASAVAIRDLAVGEVIVLDDAGPAPGVHEELRHRRLAGNHSTRGCPGGLAAIIPAAPKDSPTLVLALPAALRHLRDVMRIFVVAPEDDGLRELVADNQALAAEHGKTVEFVPETAFPFSLDDVRRRIVEQHGADKHFGPGWGPWSWCAKKSCALHLSSLTPRSPQVLSAAAQAHRGPRAELDRLRDCGFRRGLLPRRDLHRAPGTEQRERVRRGLQLRVQPRVPQDLLDDEPPPHGRHCEVGSRHQRHCAPYGHQKDGQRKPARLHHQEVERIALLGSCCRPRRCWSTLVQRVRALPHIRVGGVPGHGGASAGAPLPGEKPSPPRPY